MRVFTLAPLAGLFLAPAIPAQPDEAELKRLSGVWRGVSVTEDGKERSAEESAKVVLVVKGADYTFADGVKIIKGTHKLDPKTKPASIDAVRTSGPDKGKTLRGIYELTPTQFKVCFAPPDRDRPREFTSPPGSGLRLLVFERKKK